MLKKSKTNKDFKLIKVNHKNQLHNQLLYQFLKKRKFNISHKNIPDYKNHLSFVMNNPYRKWFLVSHRSVTIGSLYIL